MSQHNQHSTAAERSADQTAESTAPPDGIATVFETMPTVKPTLVWIGVVAVLGGLAMAYLLVRPTALGDAASTTVLFRVVFLLTLILEIRFLVRLYVLRRTTYRLDSDAVQRRYELFYRSYQREVPLGRVRSHEVRQNRVQRFLGYGTISLNEGLGGIELEDIPEPFEKYEALRDVLN